MSIGKPKLSAINVDCFQVNGVFSNAEGLLLWNYFSENRYKLNASSTQVKVRRISVELNRIK